MSTTLLDIARLLKTRIGLDPDSIGLQAIELATRTRQRARAIHDAEAYWHHLRTSPEEFQALVEAVVVPETWFFRDRGAFAVLAEHCTEAWLGADPDRTLRLLSLPCSTGEEPYSMAMALLDAGLPPHRFTIDAIDISRRALTRAEQGIYGPNSFRSDDRAYRERYLRPAGREYQVLDAVRSCVRLRRGNLFDPVLGGGLDAYDAIFCRNLLIYFDPATQTDAVRRLESLLSSSGLLIVAPSETSLLFKHGFVPIRHASGVAFGKADPRAAVAAPKAPAPRAVTRTGPRRPTPSFASVRPIAPYPDVRTVTPRAETGDELADAMRLADEGHLADAAAKCHEYLRRHGPRAQAFYLLGLVGDAEGRADEAETFYRKALYLDPDHYETLVHLAILVEQRGQIPRARALRRRARHLDEAGRSSDGHV